MELLLLRHGKAEPHGHPGGDGERALVEKGREQARRAGELIRKAGGLPDIVLTSPLLRARQTAEAFCEAAGMPGPVIQGWLACGMDPETALGELQAFHDFGRVAIVGHEPDFSALVHWVLGALGGNVEVKKGTLVCLQLHPPSRYGELLYLIPSKFTG